METECEHLTRSKRNLNRLAQMGTCMSDNRDFTSYRVRNPRHGPRCQTEDPELSSFQIIYAVFLAEPCSRVHSFLPSAAIDFLQRLGNTSLTVLNEAMPERDHVPRGDLWLLGYTGRQQ